MIGCNNYVKRGYMINRKGEKKPIVIKEEEKKEVE